MGGASSIAARFLALSVLVIIGAGLYAVVLRSDLNAAEMQLSNIAKDRDLYKLRVEQYATQGKDDARALSSCQAELAEATAQLEEAASKTAPARR